MLVAGGNGETYWVTFSISIAPLLNAFSDVGHQ
jgi:hypothetical protein